MKIPAGTWQIEVCRQPRPPRLLSIQARGFTRLDLGCLIGVLSLFLLLQIAAVARSQGPGKLLQCFTNLREMTAAWGMYAEDRGGALVGNLSGPDVRNINNTNQTWVLGWYDQIGGNLFPEQFGGRANTNSLLLTRHSPLSIYLGGAAEPFKCPADSSDQHYTIAARRLRSISMNGYVGANARAFPTPGYRVFRNLADFTVLPPSRAFIFLDERQDSLNDGCFLMSMAGFHPAAPEERMLVDYPAHWHEGGGSLSFADGHVEHWKWEDRRTMPEASGAPLTLNVPSPGNPDVHRLQKGATRPD